MVDVKKVTASISTILLTDTTPGSTANMSDIASSAGVVFERYIRISSINSDVDDSFLIFNDRDVQVTPGNVQTVTGIVIPYSRKYSISIQMQRMLVETQVLRNIGFPQVTFACYSMTLSYLLISSVTGGTSGPIIETRQNGFGLAVASGAVSANSTMTTIGPNAIYTINQSFFAGDFIYFRLNGRFYESDVSLRDPAFVTITLTEITDI